MTSLPQPHGEDQCSQLDARLLAATADLAHRAEEQNQARRAVRRLRRARRAHLRHLRRVRRYEFGRRAASAAHAVSPVGLAGLGVTAFVAAIVMFARGNAQAADMLSAAIGFWALALALKRAK